MDRLTNRTLIIITNNDERIIIIDVWMDDNSAPHLVARELQHRMVTVNRSSEPNLKQPGIQCKPCISVIIPHQKTVLGAETRNFSLIFGQTFPKLVHIFT